MARSELYGCVSGHDAARQACRQSRRPIRCAHDWPMPAESLLINPAVHDKLAGVVMRLASILVALFALPSPWFVQLMPVFNDLTILQTKNECQS
jgi:hypothetical protein